MEKIDPRDLVISNKPSLISHIEFVIPNQFKDVKVKAILFTKMVKELAQVSMVQILILQLLRIPSRVLSSWKEGYGVSKYQFPCFGILRTRFIL